jgi:hypothetical protein
MRILVVCAVLVIGLSGCRRSPVPDATLLPTPGYVRVRPPGLGFSVDLPEGWRVLRSDPDGATLAGPGRSRPSGRSHPQSGAAGGLSLYLGERALQKEQNAQQAMDGYQLELIRRLSPAPAPPPRIISQEQQQTGWLPGRLVQAEGSTKTGRAPLVIWLGVYEHRLYSIAATGPEQAQLQMREVVDHAIASLRPGRGQP